MFAARHNIPDKVEGWPRFVAPYDEWAPEQLLAHFRGRPQVRYFPVLDEVETAPARLAAILENQFEFNNETHKLAEGFDWLANPSSDIEWLILLHKGYYLAGFGRAYAETGDIRYARKWMQLTQAWIDQVSLDFLPSDVAGRRIQNWIFAHYYFVSHGHSLELDARFYGNFLGSIQQQVDYLCAHLTPARNHRTLELFAVFLAAVVFPELHGAAEWLRFSVEELHKNVATDLLADGVHCELSTDYHHIVLRNLLNVRRLATLNHIELSESFDAALRRALDFSLYVHKPDGFIPSISDGDTASFLPLLLQGYELYGDETWLYAATQGRKGTAPSGLSTRFPASGYAVLRSGWGERETAYADERYLFFDCGPLGAGNHGHLDALNIEMAAYGRSLVVDPGRYTYDESGETNWRVLFRGTGYHNTVQVDDKNQTAYAFHKHKYKIVGPEPECRFEAFISRPGFDYLHGIVKSHEYQPLHERKIFFVAGEYWIICDLLRAEAAHDYHLRFHLNPEAQGNVSITERAEHFRIDAPGLVIVQPRSGETGLTLEPGFVSPTYGVKHEAPVVCFARHGSTYCFYTLLYPHCGVAPEIDFRLQPATTEAGTVVSASRAATLLVRNGQADGLGHHDMIAVSHEAGTAFRYGDITTKSTFLMERRDAQGNLLMRLTAEADGETDVA